MPKLPVVSGKELIRALSKIGFRFIRQKGDHVILKHKDGRTAIVPLHKEIKKGTLNNIIKKVGITIDKLKELI